jgi:carboxylesterase
VNGNAFAIREGDRAVLLVHGFTASTQEVEGLAHFLASKGFSVSVPLLAGHNTSFDDFSKTSASDYLRSVREAYDELDGYESIDVLGLSFGAILAIELASTRPVRKVVLLAPAFCLVGLSARFTGLLRWHRSIMYKPLEKNPTTGIETRWDLNDAEACERRIAYEFFAIPQLHSLQRLAKTAQRDLKSLRSPILLIHSRRDRTASFEHARRVFDSVEMSTKQFVELVESGHIISDDLERTAVQDKVLRFLQS